MPRVKSKKTAKPGYAIAFVTAPDLREARRLAQEALNRRLAACANLVNKIESHYWWEGRLNTSDEVLVIFKTRKRLLRRLEQLIVEAHSYDTPEFIAFQVTSGNQRYLDWIAASTI